MTARIRNSNNGTGSFKLKRSLVIDWTTEKSLTPETLVGNDGELDRAIIFGDPYSSETKGPITILKASFLYFRNSDVDLETSAGNQHKIVDGPFFKSKENNLPEELRSIASLGAWNNNLPANCHLILTIENLVPDNVYQIRCMFIDGKNKASPKLLLDPGNHEINYDRQHGVMAVGTFTSPDKKARIKIASGLGEAPHINAIVLRRVGYNPRATIAGLRTIYDSKR